MEEPDVKVKSLYKCLKILECFTSKTPELGVSEIAKKLALNKSNVHNMLSTLSAAGYTEKNPLSEKYMLSVKMLEFSYVVTSRLRYQNIILPVMENLSQKLDSVVYFGIPHGQYVLYMFSTFPKDFSASQTYRSIMGEKAPMYCTSIGKALLTAMNDDEVLLHIMGKKERFTPKTLVDDEEILRDIRLSRERGYAVDDVEHEANIRCIGVPVFSREHALLGAMSASGTAQRVTPERVPAVAELLLAAAFEIRGSV